MLRDFLQKLMGENCASFACKLFLFIFFILIYFITIYRDNNGGSPSELYEYSMHTATSSLRSHLLKSHMNEWVSECKKLNIVSRGKEGKKAITMVLGLPVQHLAEGCVPFNQQSFTNALVQFIVATNQVFYLLILILIF